jgi:hypothetical protein
MKTFTQKNYQKQKTFSGFLPGISGTLGIPMWSFYVNRGQAIASFGVRDKNGAIMEFYPANQSYAYVQTNGFRTFLKVNGTFVECFSEKDDFQTMDVDAHQIVLTQALPTFGISISVTYFTLPQSSLAALVRRVSIKNLDGQPKHIEILDGLNQMLPSGIDHGGYKAVSNLLQSWMQVEAMDRAIFLKLRASTADSSEVSDVRDGNFYFYEGLVNVQYVYDYKCIYQRDTSFATPYGFIEHNEKTFSQQTQAAVNQVPCAFIYSAFKLQGDVTFYGVFGYGKDQAIIADYRANIDRETLDSKFQENATITHDLLRLVETQTSESMFDSYIQQCFLDNLLRGGYPLMFETKQGPVAYHVYSRKHGDLERDYNFFSLEPAYFSQGNGAFRDVLQNRRNDIYIEPRIRDFSIRQFGSFIQADGYNPLSIEGLRFKFEGTIKSYPTTYHSLLSNEFSPGEIATLADRLGDDPIARVDAILKHSTYTYRATYGEGYWEDHFTYHVDLIEAYLDVYPETIDALMFGSPYRYFVSPAMVRPRHEKYVLKEEKIRQYHAVKHDHHAPVRGWLKNKKGEDIQHTLFAKLLTLAINKFSHLDPYGMGLMYEGERPGWNDAMNGLPGLFGSGVSELFELKRLVDLLHSVHVHSEFDVLAPLHRLIESLLTISESQGMVAWDKRMTALETYRTEIYQPTNSQRLSNQQTKAILSHIQHHLQEAIDRILSSDPIIPTYFAYEAVSYEAVNIQVDHGQPTVRVLEFKQLNLPRFLEGPTRYLSGINRDTVKGQELVDRIRHSGIFDTPLNLYKTSESLDDLSMEFGRIRAFTPGWLERESDFLHMSYKYFLGLFKSGLYEQYYKDIRYGMTCFMDPLVYGRSPLENSSFIATSNNPDASKHGQGFFARLSGSTSEVLSLWKLMFFGPNLFAVHDGELTFAISPKLPATFFKNAVVKTTLFSSIRVTIHYEGTLPTYDASVIIDAYELRDGRTTVRIPNSVIKGKEAEAIRALRYQHIDVYLKGGRETG